MNMIGIEAAGEGLPVWQDDKNSVCDRIKSRVGLMKVLVKIKDELEPLKSWLSYYSDMVGDENLIIFDNMSSDPSLLDFYRTLSKDIIVIRYTGFHNHVHNVAMFPELYDALARSCGFFGFFDADERAALIFDDRHLSGTALVDFVRENRRFDAFPGTWLENAVRSPTLFNCGYGHHKLDWGLTWGKPILRSESPLDGIIMHNVQVPSASYTPDTPLNVFCLHLKYLDPANRIRINTAKLAARGFITGDEALSDILAKSTEGISDQIVQMYLDEMRRLHALEGEAKRSLCSGHLELNPDGSIAYFSAQERESVLRFIAKTGESAILRALPSRSLV